MKGETKLLITKKLPIILPVIYLLTVATSYINASGCSEFYCLERYYAGVPWNFLVSGVFEKMHIVYYLSSLNVGYGTFKVFSIMVLELIPIFINTFISYRLGKWLAKER